MQIPVLIEQSAENRFLARIGEPFALTAEGATRDEALQNVRQMVESRLANGAELAAIDVPPEENPWVRYAGTLKDDPLFDEWQEAIAEYRRERDADPDAL
jgi:hypothetical protein